jgi:hypothetical protein
MNPPAHIATPRKSFQFNAGCKPAGMEFRANMGIATIDTHVACPIQKPKNFVG